MDVKIRPIPDAALEFVGNLSDLYHDPCPWLNLSVHGNISDTERAIAESVCVPPATSIENLLAAEQAATKPLLSVWSEMAGSDMVRTMRMNTCAKRALYLSRPLFAIDTLPKKNYERDGENTRIHFLWGNDPERIVRLEAITSLVWRTGSMRYCLSIQYLRDENEQYWQVLRPLFLVPSVLSEQEVSGNEHVKQCFALLRALILQCMHDYVHGTVLTWFRRPDCPMPPDYARMVFEAGPPPTIQQWQLKAKGQWPESFGNAEFRKDIEPLELYSLMVHRDICRQLLCDRRYETYIRDLILGFGELLSSNRTRGGSFETLFDSLSYTAGWFVASGFGLDSAEMDALCRSLRTHDLRENLEKQHGGALRLIDISRDQFPWAGTRAPLHSIGNAYAAALEKHTEAIPRL